MACAEAGADIVDTAIDSISGTTSPPAVSSVTGALENTGHDAELHMNQIQEIDNYWSQIRLLYTGFDADLRSPDPDVYRHEIPGGQYSNLLFQARQLGLGSQWTETKNAYVDADALLGNIIKATPTSKAVGDLAQFMVDHSLSQDDVRSNVATLDFPASVLEFFEGLMDQPLGGFPEPLRTDILRGRREKISCRPGLLLPPVDLSKLKEDLQERYPEAPITDCDVASHLMYPEVYADYRRTVAMYGDLSVLPTWLFLTAPKTGQEVVISLDRGRDVFGKMLAVGQLDPLSGKREVCFEVDGEMRIVAVLDKNAVVEEARLKADPSKPSDVPAPMKAKVLRVNAEPGNLFERGDGLLTLSAMKMEISVSASMRGTIVEVLVVEGDNVMKDDLLVKIQKA